MEKTRSAGTGSKTIGLTPKKELTPLISSPRVIEENQNGLDLLSKSKTLVIHLLKITGLFKVPDLSTMEKMEHRPPRHSGSRNAPTFAPGIDRKINSFSR